MEVSNRSDDNFLKNLITKVYSLNTLYEKTQTSNENIKITIQEDDLRNNIRINHLLEKCYNLTQLEKWFNTFKKPEDLYSIKYPITYYLPGYTSEFINIKIYESEVFHFTVHFKLSQNLTNTFNLVTIFSLWFDRPLELNSLNLEYINLINRALLLGYKLEKRLQVLKHEQLTLLNLDTYEPRNDSNRKIPNSWVLNKPLFFITYGLSLLNANPYKLIDTLFSNINNLCTSIGESSELEQKNPEQFFLSLSSELKDFLIKGKELFYVAQDSLDFISRSEKKLSETPSISQSEKKETKALTPELLFSIFEDVFERDMANEVPLNDQGYRSLSELSKEYKEKYGFSKQTYYNCLASSNLNLIIEDRERKKKGGGTEYRIRKRALAHEIKEEDLEEMFMHERMLIENALTHYNRGEVDTSLTLFEDILKSPSTQLQENDQLYYGSKYYLGRCYLKKNEYHKAFEILKGIHEEKVNFLEVNFYLLKIFSNFHKYKDLILLLKKTYDRIEEILLEFDIESENYEMSEGFVKKIQNGDYLTRFIFFINTNKIEKKFRQSRLRPQEFNEYTKNTMASWRVKHILRFILQMNIEVKRRQIFHFVVKNDLEKVKVGIHEYLELWKSKFYKEYKEERIPFLAYSHYFQQLFKMHLPSFDIQAYESVIESLSPGFSKQIPFSYDDITKIQGLESEKYKLLNEITKFRYRGIREKPTKLESLWDYPYVIINEKLEFQEPEFIVEFIYTESFIVHQRKIILQLTELLREQMKSEKFFLSHKVSRLNAFWMNLHSLRHSYNTPEKVINRLNTAITLCRENNIMDLIAPITVLEEKLKKSINPLIKLKNKAKKEVLEKIFKHLSRKYTLKKRKQISMNYEHLKIQDDDDYFDLFYSKIQNLLWYYNGLYELRIQLPSKNVAEEIERYFHGFRKHDHNKLFNFLVFERTSDRTFSIKNEASYLYIDKMGIEENLMDLLSYFIEILKKNHNRLLIQTESTKNEKFFKNFQSYLQKELDNSYIEFIFDEPSDTMKEISLLITRKPPKKS